MNYSPPDFLVYGIFQARILEQFAISSSRGSSLPRDQSRISYFSCIGRWIPYNGPPGKPCLSAINVQYLYQESEHRCHPVVTLLQTCTHQGTAHLFPVQFLWLISGLSLESRKPCLSVTIFLTIFFSFVMNSQ